MKCGSEVLLPALASAGVVCLCIVGLFLDIARKAARNDGRRLNRPTWTTVIILTLLFAALLLRPQQDTFQGLDESAFRMMARAFAHGRSFQGTDQTLKEVPPELRSSFLYRSLRVEQRMTRDQSFQVDSLDTCKTRPFYYPLLPLSMVGFDAVVPGDVRDYLVPFLGLLFCLACIAVGASRGEGLGALVAAVFLVGSPLPAWLLRGCFPEAVGGVLIALAVLSWIQNRESSSAIQGMRFLALGLAVSFHLALIALVVPFLGVMLVETADTLRKFIGYSLLFIAGLAPVVLLTLFVATPYGEFSGANIKSSFALSASIRSTVVCAAVFAGGCLAGLAARRSIMRKVARLSERPCVSAFLAVAVSIVPTLIAARFWSYGELVQSGIKELLRGWQLPFGAVMALSLSCVFLSKRTGRAKVALAAVFLSLPVFLYLKGADQVGLWSQRRLLPSFLCMISCCLPPAAALIGRAKREEAFKGWLPVFAGILCAVGLANAIRWPAPYWVRSEHGSDAWAARMMEKYQHKLVVFDYHPYSIPFAVEGSGRFLGLGEGGAKNLSAISMWLSDQAGKEEVLWISAYENPGMEEGCALEEIGRESNRFDRVVSKTALPAIFKKRVVDMRILRVRPATDAGLLVMDKKFDGGPLGLRGDWGRTDKTIEGPDGNPLVATWSRPGSCIVGPVPLPGQSIRITIEAAARRKDDLESQTLQFMPPWEGEGLSLLVGNDYTKVSGALQRPASQSGDGGRTGVYRIRVPHPYNPRKAGIRGFGDHLGALIHRIRIECVAPDSGKRDTALR